MRRRSETAPAPAVEEKHEPALPAEPNPLLRHSAKQLDLRPGEKLTISIGAEKYFPVRYNGFEVGPFSVELVVREGETGEDAFARGYRMLAQLDEAEFTLAWDRYKARMRKIQKDA